MSKPKPITRHELKQLFKYAREQRGLMCVTEWEGDRAVRVLMVNQQPTGQWQCQEHHMAMNTWTVRCFPV